MVGPGGILTLNLREMTRYNELSKPREINVNIRMSYSLGEEHRESNGSIQTS